MSNPSTARSWRQGTHRPSARKTVPPSSKKNHQGRTQGRTQDRTQGQVGPTGTAPKHHLLGDQETCRLLPRSAPPGRPNTTLAKRREGAPSSKARKSPRGRDSRAQSQLRPCPPPPAAHDLNQPQHRVQPGEPSSQPTSRHVSVEKDRQTRTASRPHGSPATLRGAQHRLKTLLPLHYFLPASPSPARVPPLAGILLTQGAALPS